VTIREPELDQAQRKPFVTQRHSSVARPVSPMTRLRMADPSGQQHLGARGLKH
jgi:hypothetical protein